MVSYKARPNAKDFIQVEIVVEKNSQKIILIGKVSLPFIDSALQLYPCLALFVGFLKMEVHHTKWWNETAVEVPCLQFEVDLARGIVIGWGGGREGAGGLWI